MRRRLGGELPSFETPPGYEVRSLRAGEEAAWVALKNACFPEDTAWQPEHFQRELSEAPCFDLERILVATQEGRLVGTTIAWETEYGDRPEGLIHWVGVHPDHRGGGLAKALNALAMRQLAEHGYAEAWLNTSRSRAAAVGLYESMGFEVHRELYTYELTL
jgi:mycothiol synthase